MPWNTRNSRVRRVEEQLQHAGPASAEQREDLRRRVVVAGLCAAACVSVACGHDIREAAARCAVRLRAFPPEEWPALFDEARAGLRGTAAQLAVLEALIEAVKQAPGAKPAE